MVTYENPSAPLVQSPFSFSSEMHGESQQVSVIIGGLEYPGEVVVASEWDSEFGSELSGTAMFRLVLLQSSSRPNPDELMDPRICVAIQANQRVGQQRVAETKAPYTVHPSGTDQPVDVEQELNSIREVKERYSLPIDSEVDRLTSALAARENRINNSVAQDLHLLWRGGEIVTSLGIADEHTESEQIFLLDDPSAWLDTAAKTVIRQPLVVTEPDALIRIQSEIQQGHSNTAKDQLRRLCHIALNEPTPNDRIETLLTANVGSASGGALLDLLVHDMGLPPEISKLWIGAYVIEKDAEVEFESPLGSTEFLTTHTVDETDFEKFDVANITGIRSAKSDHWDAVLPFLKLVSPHSNSTRYGGGRSADSEEFSLQLNAISERLQATSPVMLSLEIAAGAIERPLTGNDAELLSVLDNPSWQVYVGQAREIYGSVSKLREALSGAALRWSAVEYAPEIERTIYYLDQIDFGRLDHGLAAERHILRSRFDVQSLVESPESWLALRDEFERWRLDYRRAYLEDHTEKQRYNRELQQRIGSSSKLVDQIEKLEQIDAIKLNDIGELNSVWRETIRSSAVCDRDGADIPLIDEPVCTLCRGRLGQSANHTDINEMIARVENLFASYRDRLASVVSGLVMDEAVPDNLQSLFRLNSAGDLSGLANVLDDKVISFLNELFGSSDGSSGSTGDWTSPQS